MTCLKCGGGPINGPRYEGKGCNERLRYSCDRCGYSWTEPCADAREPKEIRRLIDEIKRVDEPRTLPLPQPWRLRPQRDDDDSRYCVLNKPLLLVIPHGGMRISCPVHHEGHFIRGTEFTCAVRQATWAHA